VHPAPARPLNVGPFGFGSFDRFGERGSMRATEPFVYHLVPPDLRGTVLYPLNQLKTIHPEIAAKQMAKYAGRVHVLQQRVPTLDCMWNDVLMFSPVHPAALKAAMEEAGHVRFPRRWFEINAQRFTRDNTALYLPGETPEEAQIMPYEPGCLADYAHVSEAQKRFYRRVEPGKPVLLFGGTPHVLYKGSLHIDQARVLEI
jgi:hypothetical protein